MTSQCTGITLITKLDLFLCFSVMQVAVKNISSRIRLPSVSNRQQTKLLFESGEFILNHACSLCWLIRIRCSRKSLLLVTCLAAAEQVDGAKTMLATVAAQYAKLGSFHYILGGGLHVRCRVPAPRHRHTRGWSGTLGRLPTPPSVHRSR